MDKKISGEDGRTFPNFKIQDGVKVRPGFEEQIKGQRYLFLVPIGIDLGEFRPLLR